jgi:hypothetical protein
VAPRDAARRDGAAPRLPGARALKLLEPDLVALGLSPREIINDAMVKQAQSARELFTELGVSTTMSRELIWRGVGAVRELVFNAGTPPTARVAATLRALWHRPDFAAEA